MSKPVSEKFLADIIAEAKQLFVSGSKRGVEFLSTADTSKLHSFEVVNDQPSILSVKDKDFIRNANRLPTTNFVAAMGPQHSGMEHFFADTIDNKKCYIDEVVALSDRVSINPGRPAGEFHDYGLRERAGGVKYGDSKNTYHVTVKRLKGSVVEAVYTRSPKDVVESELTITSTKNKKKRKLHVIFLSVPDGKSLDITSDTVKDILLEIAKKSETKVILVHCASGIGRTGNLILTIELLKRYNQIFASSTDPKQIAKAIYDLLKQISVERPQLVFHLEQFTTAISNAHLLFKYKLEKEFWLEMEEFVAPQVKVKLEVTKSGEVDVALDTSEFAEAAFEQKDFTLDDLIKSAELLTEKEAANLQNNFYASSTSPHQQSGFWQRAVDSLPHPLSTVIELSETDSEFEFDLESQTTMKL